MKEDGKHEQNLLLLGDIATVDDINTRIGNISHELDEIELQFAHEISLKTDVFFQETAHLGQLMEQTASCKQALGYLQNELSSLNKDYLIESTNLRTIVEQHQVLMRVCCLFTKMMDLVKGQLTIQSLLDTHSFVDALRLIDEKINVLNTDLRQVKVFDHLRVELQEMKVALEKMMSANLEI